MRESSVAVLCVLCWKKDSPEPRIFREFVKLAELKGVDIIAGNKRRPRERLRCFRMIALVLCQLR